MDVDAELKKIRKTFRNKYPKDVIMQFAEDYLKDKTHPLATKYLRASGADEGAGKLKVGNIVNELEKLGFERDKTENTYYRGVVYKGISFLIKGDKHPYVELEEPFHSYYIRSNSASLASFIREIGDNMPLWATELEKLYSENRDKIEELEMLSWSPKHSSEPISVESMFRKKVEVLDALYCQKVDHTAKDSFIHSLEDEGYFYKVDGKGRVKIELNHIVVDYSYTLNSCIEIKSALGLKLRVRLSGGTFTLLKKLDDLTPVWLDDLERKHQTLLKQFKVDNFNSKAITLLVKTKMKSCGYDYCLKKVGDGVKLMIRAKAKRFVSCSFKGSDIHNIEKQLNDICHYVEIINQMNARVKIGVYGKDISWEKNGGTDYN